MDNIITHILPNGKLIVYNNRLYLYINNTYISYGNIIYGTSTTTTNNKYVLTFNTDFQYNIIFIKAIWHTDNGFYITSHHIYVNGMNEDYSSDYVIDSFNSGTNRIRTVVVSINVYPSYISVLNNGDGANGESVAYIAI